MITSVTSSTIASTSAAAGWVAVLSAGGALLVIGLLIALELLGATDRPGGMLLQRSLRVTTVPLVVVFAVSIAVKAMAILTPT
jgi:hypothetical protein